MLINATTTLDAFQKCKDYLSSMNSVADKELEKEEFFTIIFNNLEEDDSIPKYNGDIFDYPFDYSEYFSNKLAEDEFEHYQNLLNLKIRDIIPYLINYPFSKRALINVWDDSQKILDNKAECLIYLMFRKLNNKLDMHVHMRANDANSKSLLNFHIFAAIHKHVSKEVNEKTGTYYHITDSYHIYK